MIQGIRDLHIIDAQGAGILNTVLGCAGVGDGRSTQNHSFRVADTVFAGAVHAEALDGGLALGVVDTVGAGLGNLDIFQRHSGIVVDALRACTVDGQTLNIGSTLVVVEAVLLGGVHRDIGTVQSAVVVHTVILGVCNRCTLQGHGAVVLDAVASCAGVADLNIVSSHGSLVVDAMLCHVADRQAADRHSRAGLVIDTVLAGIADGQIGGGNGGCVVDALLHRIGDLNILQYQLVFAGNDIEAVSGHIIQLTVLNSQRTFFHVCAVVAHFGSFHAGHSGGTGLVLNGILFDIIHLQAVGSDLTAVVVDAVAVHIVQRNIVEHQTAAFVLEAVLGRILNVHLIQFHVCACIQLDCSGAGVFDGAVIQVGLAAVGIDTVLFTVCAQELNIVHHGLTIAHDQRLIPAHIQRTAVDGQVAACVGNVGVTAALDGDIDQIHVAGEIIDGAGIAADGSEVLRIDRAAVVGQAVNLCGIHSGILHIQLAGGIVHDAALSQQHIAHGHFAVVAQAVDAVADVTAGDLRIAACCNHNTILGCAVIDAAGHGEAAALGNIDVMEGRLRDFAAFLGEAAAVVNGRAGLGAGNNASAQTQLAVVEHIVSAAVQQLTAFDQALSLGSQHNVCVTAVLNGSFVTDFQGALVRHVNTIAVIPGIHGDVAAQSQACACIDLQQCGHGGAIRRVLGCTAHTPGGRIAFGPLSLQRGIQQNLTIAHNRLCTVHFHRTFQYNITVDLNGLDALICQQTGQLLRRYGGGKSTATGQQQDDDQDQNCQTDTACSQKLRFLLILFHLMVSFLLF